jgi:prolyl-tRNA synthetase
MNLWFWPTREAAVVFCSDCSYAANVEKAECQPRPAKGEEAPKYQADAQGKVHTPDCKSIEQVADFLGVRKTSLVKSLMYKGDGRFLLILVRGDREVNEIKVNNALGPFIDLRLAAAEEVAELLHCEPGFVGPVGVPSDILIAADSEVAEMNTVICGANQKDCHLVQHALRTGFYPASVLDLR